MSRPRRRGPRRILPLLVAALGLAASRPAVAAVAVPSNFVNDVIATGLDEPTSLAFLPDGRAIVTEQHTGKVRMIVNGHIAATDPMLVVPSLNGTGYEAGLQGVTVHPAFPDSPYVFLFHNRTGGFLRLVRYRAIGDLANPNGENVTLTQPLLLIDDIPDVTPNHNAGCLRFGPDGMLYVSLGEDDNFPCAAADLTSLRGQILRLRVDQLPPGGGAQVARALLTPPDNPFAGHANANAKLVYAYGMRNPWRYQIDRMTGTIYGCDVGEADFEEQNEIHAGDFLGWPWREANLTITRGTCPEPGGPGAQPYVAPIASFSRDGALHAIVSAGMYRPAPYGNRNWPLEYWYPDKGSVFYLDYYIGKLKRIRWTGSSWIAAAPSPGQPAADAWGTGFTSAVDFLVGNDGSLYWLQQYNSSFDPESGSLNRIRSTDTTDVPPYGAPPIMRVAPNPSSGAVDLAFELPQAATIALEIYDLAGRRRATVFEGEAAPGLYQQRWNGLDERGEIVPAGLYFAKLRRGHEAIATARVLRVK